MQQTRRRASWATAIRALSRQGSKVVISNGTNWEWNGTKWEWFPLHAKVSIDDAWVGKRNGRRLPGSDSNCHEHMTPASGTPSGGLLVEKVEESLRIWPVVKKESEKCGERRATQNHEQSPEQDERDHASERDRASSRRSRTTPTWRAYMAYNYIHPNMSMSEKESLSGEATN